MAFVPLLPIPIQLQDGTTSVNMSSGTLEFYLAGTSTPTNIFSDNSGTVAGTSVTLNAAGYPASGATILTLFRDSSVALKIIGKNAAGTEIWSSDNLKDSLVILASTANTEGASLVGVEDSNGYWAVSDLEGVLDEIGGNYTRKDRSETIAAIWTWSSGSLNMNDLVISKAHLQDYSVVHAVASSSSNAITYNYASAQSFVTTLTENITTVTLSAPPATGRFGQITIKFIQDGAGGAYTVAWPASVLWPGGTAPTITTSNNAVDQVTLWTIDAGTTWYGNFSQAYA